MFQKKGTEVIFEKIKAENFQNKRYKFIESRVPIAKARLKKNFFSLRHIVKVMNTKDLKSSQRKKRQITFERKRCVYRDVAHHKVQDSEHASQPI